MSLVHFVHIGDVHLADNAREADRLAALDQIIEENSRRRTLGAWLLPGDVFDARSTVATRNAFAERVHTMLCFAPLVLVPGNHDVPGDLEIFTRLHSRYRVHYADRPQVLRFECAPDGPGREAGHPGITWVNVFVLPYPTAAGLVAAGVSQPDIPAAARAKLEAIFIWAGDLLEKARKRCEIALMAGHANMTGAVPSIGQPPIGAEIELDGGLLAHLGPCYKGLNHIHAAQVVGGAYQDADYAGSICRLSWGETDPKSYTVAEYSLEESGWIYYQSERHPVRVAPMWHVEGEFSRAGFSWHATKGPDGARVDPPATWEGCDVRARMRYRQSEGIVLADAQRDIKAAFAGARRFEFEPVCMPDRAVRAPAVLTARTLLEKVQAWADVTGVVLAADVAKKLAALETQDGESLVAAQTEVLEWLAASDEQRMAHDTAAAAVLRGGAYEGPAVRAVPEAAGEVRERRQGPEEEGPRPVHAVLPVPDGQPARAARQGSLI